jgi:hypothetical protein
METEAEKRKLTLEISGEAEERPISNKDKVLAEITSRMKSAQEAQLAITEGRKRAEAATDPEEQQRELEEVIKQEKRAASELKIVQRLQSGVWQGGASGAGIGAGVGLGLGTVVGSVVGGVVAIPTTGLGLLAGAATGAIHGPWVKFGMGDKKDGEDAGYEEVREEGGT